MTNAEARKVFDSAIAKSEHEPETVAKLELCREYFTNPTFKAWMEDKIWKLNSER